MQLLLLEELEMYGSSIRSSQPVLAAQPLRMKRKKVWCNMNLQMPKTDCTDMHQISSATLALCAFVMQG